MRIVLLCAAAVVLGAALMAAVGPEAEHKSAAAEPAGPMLSHDVYFTLKDKSPEAKAKLAAACRKYLSNQPGTVWFAAGPLAAEFQREVNDRDFDVALHLVFKDKAAHDQYQDSPAHQNFLAEHGDAWESVRVFDSYLTVTGHGEVEMPAQAAR
jgi:quinol monooxygenase YgiN